MQVPSAARARLRFRASLTALGSKGYEKTINIQGGPGKLRGVVIYSAFG